MKKNAFYAVLITVLLSYPILLSGQPPQIIPVSPEASALAKMINYPVNKNTGVPDISIPFYEIQAGSMNLPLTLQYHAGGFRINEQATRAGLGWSLSSDLQITQTVNGKNDLAAHGYISNDLVKTYYPNPSACPTCDYPKDIRSLYYLAIGDKDGSPDKFNYKLLNKSGSFYFQKNDTGTGYSIVPVPFDNIKIEYILGAFKITDTDGTIYSFGLPDTAPMTDVERGIERSGSIQGDGSCPGGDCYPSAWKCMKIKSGSGADEINFTYVRKQLLMYRSHHDRVEYYTNDNPCSLSGSGYFMPGNALPLGGPYENILAISPFYRISSPKYMVHFGANTSSYFHVPYLDANDDLQKAVYPKIGSGLGSSANVAGLSMSEISFRGGKVVFIGADQLSYIRVSDADGVELKSMHFFHSYTQPFYFPQAQVYNGSNFQGTRYLDSLQVRNGTTAYERYSLVYESKYCYGSHLKGSDAWGYPNALTKEIAQANMVTGNQLHLPSTTIIQKRVYRDVDGGCLNFKANVPVIFGDNNWAETPSANAMKRGILKQIVYPTGGYTDFDFEPNQYLESFAGVELDNKVHQLSGGLRIRSINNYDETGKHVGQTYYRYGLKEEGTGILINRPTRTMEAGKYHYGASSYEQQIGYVNGSALSLLAVENRTTYQPASVQDYTYSNGAPIYYQKVTEYKQDLGQEVGRTTYTYYPPGQFHDYLDAPLYQENRIPGTNISYLKTQGLIGMLKSEASYRYHKDTGYQLIAEKEYEYERYLRPSQIRVSYAFLNVVYDIVEGSYPGTMADLYAETEWLSSPIIYGDYGIASARVLLKKETSTSYEGANSSQTVSEYSYSNLPFLQPTQITARDSKGLVVTREMKYPFNSSGTVYGNMVDANRITPLVEEAKYRGGVEVSRKRTNYSDFSVGFNLIAPSSLQSSINGTPLRTELSFTEYDHYGNVLQFIGLDQLPISYLWGYQDRYPVAELRGVRYSEIPSSYKGSSTVNNPTSDAGLQTFLDGLRTTFSGSEQISTYSYKRLTGIQRHVDPSGRSAYYEYDPIGRLAMEKDHNQHVVAKYDYHMRGPTSPAVTYTNIPLMRSYSEECVEVAPGSYKLFNYTLPGGTLFNSSSQSLVDATARIQMGTPVFPEDPPPCIPGSVLVNIILNYEFGWFSGIPYMMEIDFIKDGSIVATYPVWAMSALDIRVYLPPGAYQLSVRVNADVNYEVDSINYAFLGPTFGGNFVSDMTYLLEPEEYYQFIIYTTH